MGVFYDSKLYFYLMLEWMFFVFIILHTESLKLHIDKQIQIQNEIELQEFMHEVKQKPQKIKEFIELKKKVDTKK